MSALPPIQLRKIVAAVAMVVLVAAGCGSSDDLSDVAAIESNDGAIKVRPPDVLDGDTVVGDDGVDPASAGGETRPDITEFADGRPNVAFEWFDGRQGDIASLAGTPTVVNFWASTCAACIAEMPEFEEVFIEGAGKVNFVGFNVADQREAALRLAGETGVTYPLADDPKSEVFRSFGGFVMPTTVFLDANGDVAFGWNGVLTASELKKVINEHIAPGTFPNV